MISKEKIIDCMRDNLVACDDGYIEGREEAADDILAAISADKREDLAVLADRKGATLFYGKNEHRPQVDIDLCDRGKSFQCDTYNEAEDAARSWLNSLEDKV